MPEKRVKEFLESHNVSYETIVHRPAYTAQETAQSAHIGGKELAKIVMVEIDGKLAMAVLPASGKLDLGLLKQAAGAKRVRLAHESDFEARFPGCDAGAMPPFGNLYGMEVFVADTLAAGDRIAFNAGSHTELIRTPYREFERLVHPRVAKLSLGHGAARGAAVS